MKTQGWTTPSPDEPVMTTYLRFKELDDAKEALSKRDYTKAEKIGSKGWRDARWEIGLIMQQNTIENLS